MSAHSAAKTRKLGYTNVKVYRDGVQTWTAKHYTLISPAACRRVLAEQGNAIVLIDARPAKEAARGFIPGAISLPGATAARLPGALPAKERKPPVVIYDAEGGKLARDTARLLLQQGYTDIKVLSGGYGAWKLAKYPTGTGTLPVTASYAPKPLQGEIDLAEFKKDAERLPSEVMILDVRNPDEVKAGMVKTAKNIPFEELKARMAQIPKDKLIVTQCTTGVRAEMAYHWLKELGFASVKYLNATVTFGKDGSYEIAGK